MLSQLVGEDSNWDYKFIYDDSDKSVKFRDDIEDVCVQIPFRRYENIGKLRLIGFEKPDLLNYYFYNICEYRVLCLDYVLDLFLLLKVNILGRCYVNVKFYNNETKACCNIISESLPFGFYSGNPYILNLQIPPEMLDYILSLKSMYDFDGIMSAFDNMLGIGLLKVIDCLYVVDVQLKRWL